MHFCLQLLIFVALLLLGQPYAVIITLQLLLAFLRKLIKVFLFVKGPGSISFIMVNEKSDMAWVALNPRNFNIRIDLPLWSGNVNGNHQSKNFLRFSQISIFWWYFLAHKNLEKKIICASSLMQFFMQAIDLKVVNTASRWTLKNTPAIHEKFV